MATPWTDIGANSLSYGAKKAPSVNAASAAAIGKPPSIVGGSGAGAGIAHAQPPKLPAAPVPQPAVPAAPPKPATPQQPTATQATAAKPPSLLQNIHSGLSAVQSGLEKITDPINPMGSTTRGLVRDAYNYVGKGGLTAAPGSANAPKLDLSNTQAGFQQSMSGGDPHASRYVGEASSYTSPASYALGVGVNAAGYGLDRQASNAVQHEAMQRSYLGNVAHTLDPRKTLPTEAAGQYVDNLATTYYNTAAQHFRGSQLSDASEQVWNKRRAETQAAMQNGTANQRQLNDAKFDLKDEARRQQSSKWYQPWLWGT